MSRFLEIATGVHGFEIQERVEDARGVLIPFHIRVVVPQKARARIGLIERIVAWEKPAHTTSEIVVREESGRIEGVID